MSDKNIQDRAAGAIMGAFIGDALGLGPHWYYDLSELRRDYGDWIADYADPKPNRYHAGLKAGQLTVRLSMARVVTPANQFVKPGGDAYSKSCIGGRPVVMPIPPRQQSVRWPLLFVMRSDQTNSR